MGRVRFRGRGRNRVRSIFLSSQNQQKLVIQEHV